MLRSSYLRSAKRDYAKAAHQIESARVFAMARDGASSDDTRAAYARFVRDCVVLARSYARSARFDMRMVTRMQGGR